MDGAWRRAENRIMTLRALTVTFMLFSAVSLSAQQNAGRTVEASDADYIVGAHDVLMITSYDQPGLSGKFTVEVDGTFSFPMLGRVDVGGMALREVERLLKRQLVERGLFNNPQITVAINQYRSRKIFVLGEVRKPGVYPLSGAMRLVEALALADSTLPTGSSEVVIIPATDGFTRQPDQSVIRVNLRELEIGDMAQNVALKDGDTIMVPRAEDVYVFGQVKSPGAYALRQDDMTVLQALSLAGGVTDRGSTGRIEIVRIVDGERVEIKADLADLVLPGDTVVVKERFF